MIDEIIMGLSLNREATQGMKKVSRAFLDGRIMPYAFKDLVNELLGIVFEMQEEECIGSSKPYMFNVDEVNYRELANKGVEM